MEILSVDGEGEDLRFRVRDGGKEGFVELEKEGDETFRFFITTNST